MCQRFDQRIIEQPNNIFQGTFSDSNEALLRPKFITPYSDHYPSDAMHIWAENVAVQRYSNQNLSEIDGHIYPVEAVDLITNNLSKTDINRSNERS